MIAGDRRSLARVLAAQQEANPAEIGNFSIRRTQLVFAWKIAIFPQMKKVGNTLNRLNFSRRIF